MRLLIGICFAALVVCPVFAEDANDLVDVRDFGAVSADGVDDTAAVNQAIKYCTENGKEGIVFPKGRYEFYAPMDYDRMRRALKVSGAKGFVVDGDGSELMFDGMTGCFEFSQCEGVTIRNLTIDWVRPTISCGEIIACGEKSFDVKVADEFPVSGSETVAAFMMFDPKTTLPMVNGREEYASEQHPFECELVSKQVLRVNVDSSNQVPPKGELVALRHRASGGCGFVFMRCKDVQIEGVTVYFCIGLAFYGNRSENITMENCQVMLKPGSKRLFSATADATHWTSCEGEINIKDCLFEGMGDDALNTMMGLYLTIFEKVDERTVLCRRFLKGPCEINPGEMMELTDANTIQVIDTLKVANVEPGGPDYAYKVTFTEPLPERMQVGNLIGSISHNAKLNISGVTVRRNRARGFLIQVHGATVENCRFENVTSSGIYIITEARYFYECAPARDVTIRNCEFINCNYGVAQGFAPITAQTLINEGTSKMPGVFKNIVIENNRIDGGHNGGIYLNCVENAVIRGNTIVNVCDEITGDGTGAAITLSACKDVVLENNTAELKSQGAKCKQSLLIDEYCIRDTIKVTGNTGF